MHVQLGDEHCEVNLHTLKCEPRKTEQNIDVFLKFSPKFGPNLAFLKLSLSIFRAKYRVRPAMPSIISKEAQQNYAA